MASYRNSKDLSALKEKYESPTKDVPCPGCGEPLHYVKEQSAEYACCKKCKIHFGTRGL